MVYRENELLKHQLKKYVGAVQALRSDLQGRATETAEGKAAFNFLVRSVRRSRRGFQLSVKVITLTNPNRRKQRSGPITKRSSFM